MYSSARVYISIFKDLKSIFLIRYNILDVILIINKYHILCSYPNLEICVDFDIIYVISNLFNRK